jgi:transposase
MAQAKYRLCSVLARYRYRLYPQPHQELMLARTFGCARVVFNDSLRVREAAYAAGRKVAAGQADTVNACGGTVRPGHAPAGPGETGTRRSAA